MNDSYIETKIKQKADALTKKFRWDGHGKIPLEDGGYIRRGYIPDYTSKYNISKFSSRDHIHLWNDGFYLKKNMEYTGRQLIDLYIEYCRIKKRSYNDDEFKSIISDVENTIIDFDGNISLRFRITNWECLWRDSYNKVEVDILDKDKNIYTTFSGKAFTYWNDYDFIPITSVKSEDEIVFDYNYKDRIWNNNGFIKKLYNHNNKISIEDIIELYLNIKDKKNLNYITLDNGISIDLSFKDDDSKISNFNNVVINVYDKSLVQVDRVKTSDKHLEKYERFFNYLTNESCIEEILERKNEEIKTKVKTLYKK